MTVSDEGGNAMKQFLRDVRCFVFGHQWDDPLMVGHCARCDRLSIRVGKTGRWLGIGHKTWLERNRDV